MLSFINSDVEVGHRLFQAVKVRRALLFANSTDPSAIQHAAERAALMSSEEIDNAIPPVVSSTKFLSSGTTM